MGIRTALPDEKGDALSCLYIQPMMGDSLSWLNAINDFIEMFPKSGIYTWWQGFYGTSFWYTVIFALLIIGFTFFYNSISFNPIELSKNMQQNGGMIPGIRQGRPTSEYIARISRRITLFGAMFLALLAVLPTIFWNLVGISLPLVSSSLLIAVSVAIETMRQLESQMTMRHYKGFLN
jgi:preprotein translocase subunit SecY